VGTLTSTRGKHPRSPRGKKKKGRELPENLNGQERKRKSVRPLSIFRKKKKKREKKRGKSGGGEKGKVFFSPKSGKAKQVRVV